MGHTPGKTNLTGKLDPKDPLSVIIDDPTGRVTDVHTWRFDTRTGNISGTGGFPGLGPGSSVLLQPGEKGHQEWIDRYTKNNPQGEPLKTYWGMPTQPGSPGSITPAQPTGNPFINTPFTNPPYIPPRKYEPVVAPPIDTEQSSPHGRYQPSGYYISPFSDQTIPVGFPNYHLNNGPPLSFKNPWEDVQSIPVSTPVQDTNQQGITSLLPPQPSSNMAPFAPPEVIE